MGRRWQHVVVSSLHIEMHLQEMAVIILSNFLFHLMAINPGFLHPSHSTKQNRHHVFFRGFFFFVHYLEEKISSTSSSS